MERTISAEKQRASHNRRTSAGIAVAGLIAAGTSLLLASQSPDGEPRTTPVESTTTQKSTTTEKSKQVNSLEAGGEIVVSKLKPSVNYFAESLAADESGQVSVGAMAPNGEGVDPDITQFSMIVDKGSKQLVVNVSAKADKSNQMKWEKDSIVEIDAQLIQPGVNERTTDDPMGNLVIAELSADFTQGNGSIANFQGILGDTVYSSQPKVGETIEQATNNGVIAANQVLQELQAFVGTK